MNIKDQETHDMARELAKLRGQKLSEAVKHAIRRELKHARLAHSKRRRPLVERLDEIAQRCGSHPDLDDRSADEIIGYDEHGLPNPSW